MSASTQWQLELDPAWGCEQAAIQEVCERLAEDEAGAGPRLPFRTNLVTARKANADDAA